MVFLGECKGLNPFQWFFCQKHVNKSYITMIRKRLFYDIYENL